MLDMSTTNSFIILIALAFTAIALALICFAVKEAIADHRLIKKRLEGNWKKQETGTILRQNQVFENFANHLTLPDEDEITKIRAKLSRAGFYGTSSVKNLLRNTGYQLGCAANDIHALLGVSVSWN